MAEGIPRGPRSAAPLAANFKADIPLSSKMRELGRDVKRHVVSTHLLAPPASYVRGKSLQAAQIPIRKPPGDGEDGGVGTGRLWRGLLASSAGNLFFLLPPCLSPDGMQFLLLNPTVEHRSGGIAPSSQAPCTTQPYCEYWPWVTSAPRLPQPSLGLVAPPVPYKSLGMWHEEG